MGIGANLITETLTSEGGRQENGSKRCDDHSRGHASGGLGRGVGLLLGVGTTRTQKE